MRTTSGKFLGVTVLAGFRVKRVDIKTPPRRSSSHPFFFFLTRLIALGMGQLTGLDPEFTNSPITGHDASVTG